jgi:hypothetical protein
MFDFVMKMFSEGDAAIPALEEIPKQLASNCQSMRLYLTQGCRYSSKYNYYTTVSKSNRILLL